MDSQTTTPGDLDTLDARFSCETCSSSVVTIMSWKMAIQHARSHGNKQRSEWRVLSAVESAYARALETRAEINQEKEQQAFVWSCNHCRARLPACILFQRGHIIEHVRIVHGIEAPMPTTDYIRDPNGDFAESTSN